MNINVNSTQADSALALLPMFVPGALTSVQPTGFAHLGVPLVIYPAPTGLAMVVDPVTTLSTTLAAFDTVVVWLNGQPTSAIKIIQPGEENDRILMYLPPGLLVNGINTMFYRVTRPSGNFEDSTPILNVLFNNPAPTITVSHPASIGPGQPAVITLTVGYARPYDTVTLTIGTWNITFTNPDPTKPITHTLTAAELQQIGDGTHSVSARVVDQLTNSNVSATSTIDIRAQQQLIVPTLSNVLDGSGNEVPEGTSTTSFALTLKGEAHPRLDVEIFDGSGPSAAPKGKTTAGETGDWQYMITVPLGARRLYAKSLYHPNDVYSNVRLLTVESQRVVNENFNAVPSQDIFFNQPLVLSTLTLSLLRGAINIQPMSGGTGIPGKIEGQVIRTGQNFTQFSVKPSFICSWLTFWYSRVESPGGKVRAFDLQGSLLEEADLHVNPIAFPDAPLQVIFVKPSIAYVEIAATDFCYFDNVAFGN